MHKTGIDMDWQYEAESLVIIMDEFLLVPNICPSSVIFLFNNLTYQICNTLWPSHIHNSGIYMDCNMKPSHFAMIMEEFILVPNICPSSAIFLPNNLSYQICDTL